MQSREPRQLFSGGRATRTVAHDEPRGHGAAEESTRGSRIGDYKPLHATLYSLHVVGYRA